MAWPSAYRFRASRGPRPRIEYCLGPTATICCPGWTASANTSVSLAVTVAPRRGGPLVGGGPPKGGVGGGDNAPRGPELPAAGGGGGGGAGASSVVAVP